MRNTEQDLLEIKANLGFYMKADFIDIWLDTPNPAFGNQIPREMIMSGNSDRIYRMMDELDSGVAS